MIVTYADDPRVTTFKTLDSTGNILLVDTDPKEVKTLEGLIVSCDATPTAFSLYIRDNGVDYPVVNAHQVAANDVYPNNGTRLPNIKIKGGQQLRVQAGGASHLTVVAVTIDSVPKRDNRGTPAGAVS